VLRATRATAVMFFETNSAFGDFVAQGMARNSELECTSLAFEETHTERLLELFHLMADCGRREKQLIRGDLELQ
jgi:hypothetical protein